MPCTCSACCTTNKASTRRPVFVFGLPRSGTTLIEQVLGSHSRVHPAGELRLARQSFDGIPGALGRSGPPIECVAQLDAAAVGRLAEEHDGRLAARFQQYRRIMKHWRAVLPVPMCEVDYEDVVADLEGAARRLVAACGLEWEPACLEFYRLERPVRTASVGQVRQPAYSRSVGRWKNYERELAELFALLPCDEKT